MKMPLLLRINNAYLCPGDEEGAHITDNSIACACGNTNLFSLARILERETIGNSIVDILQEEHPELEHGVCIPGKVYQG